MINTSRRAGTPDENELNYQNLLSFRQSQYEKSQIEETSHELAKARLRQERIEKILANGVLSLECLLSNSNYLANDAIINSIKSVILKDPTKDKITFSLDAYSSLTVDRPRECNYNSKYEDFMIKAFFQNSNQIRLFSQQIEDLVEPSEIKTKLTPLAELIADCEEGLLKNFESKNFPVWARITNGDFNVKITDDNNVSISLLCTSFSAIFLRKFANLVTEQLRVFGFSLEDYSYDLDVQYPLSAGYEDSSEYRMTNKASFQIILPKLDHSKNLINQFN
jgi:hypothetical protein